MTSRFPTEQERAKRDVLGKLLELGLVAIQLDTRVDGVDVPSEHLGQPALVLNLSRKFNQRILVLGPLSITASLSFGGNPYTCEIPYGAIYSVVSQSEGKHFLFAESIPKEMQQPPGATEEVGSEGGATPEPEDDPPSGPPALRLIK